MIARVAERDPCMTGKRLKILFHSWSLAGGGAERVFAVLASGLAKRGHEVIFSVEHEDNQNQRYLDAAVRQTPPTGGRWETIRKLVDLMKTEQPDISISAISACNMRHALAAFLAGRRHRSIMTYHGHSTAEPEFSNQIGYWATWLTSRITARTVAVSDGLRRHVVKDWHASRKRTVRIYNPTLVSTGETAAATEADLLARDPVVLSVGSFLPRKNFIALVQAFALVQTPGARLLILGQGRMQEAIEAEVGRLGLQDRVSLPGYLPEPWQAYAQARCFAFASREESFGLVLVEALAAGLPITVTPSDGPNEVLDDGAFGTFVPHDDPTAMAAAIDAMLTAPGDPQPRLQRARDFSVETGIQAYEDMFQTVAWEADRRGL
jgi:glycosyltransferase involved in cell wall biosynthesis